MPKKCESCKHYGNLSSDGKFENGFCNSRALAVSSGLQGRSIPITLGREICDVEGDGIFVHFEPKTPVSGVGFDIDGAIPDISRVDAAKPGPSQLAMRAAA
jgi:hypothetical protein